jgi:hypothetical protein
MVNVLTASIAVPESCDVQVGCDFLHGDGPKYTASTSIGAIIVGRFERRRFTAEDGVKETTRFSGLCNGLTNRKGLCLFL